MFKLCVVEKYILKTHFEAVKLKTPPVTSASCTEYLTGLNIQDPRFQGLNI